MSTRSVDLHFSRRGQARRFAPLLVVGLLGIAPTVLEGGARADADPVVPLELSTTYGADTAGGRAATELSSSELRAAVERIQADESASTANSTGEHLLVEVHSSLPTDALTAIVEAAGGTVNGSIEGVLVQARVPADRLAALEARPEVDYVSTPGRVDIPQDEDQGSSRDGRDGGTQTGQGLGPRLGEHVGVTAAGAWHTAGVRGAGVKIGIIDGYGSAWATSQAAGEVPAPAGMICRIEGTNCDSVMLTGPGTHGVSVAETVVDIAPAATLYLGQAATPADLQAVVDYFIAQGVRIITRSQSAIYDGPGNGIGAVDTVVDNAVAAGITWFNSAGNSAGDATNLGGYWRGSWADANHNGFLDFKPGIELMEYTCDSLFLGLRWSDWADNKTDYDLLIYTDAYDIFGDFLPNQYLGLNRQQTGAPPIERPSYPDENFSCVQGATYWIAIGLWLPGNGTAGDVLEIMLNNGTVEFSSNPFSATQAASDSKSPGALSIGAMGSGKDDPFGIVNAYYSSQGPTNDNRIKPDMAATSCVDTLASANAGFPCFNGTSAATPVAAGAAALVLGAGLASTPAQLKTYMQAAVIDRGVAGPDNIFGTGQLHLPNPPGFHPVSPDRVFDTRPNESLGALRSVIKAKIVGNNTLEVKVTDLPGVPATGVAAVSLNVVVTNTEGAGYVTVYPCGERKVVSSVNYGPNQTVANAVIAPVSPTGTVCFYSPVAVDVLADINGWFPSGDFTPVSPDRIFDTRAGESPNALRSVTKTKVGAGYVLEVKVTDLPGGIVPASGVAAVSLNVVATNPEGNGFLTVFPCGTRKEVSSVNYTAGSTVANAVIAPVSPTGTICLYSQVLADVLADINGWFAGGSFVPVSPSRVFDTRPGLGTDALRGVNKAKISGATILEVKMTDLPGGIVPATGVGAVSLNVIVTNPEGAGYLTVYPCGTRKEVSSVNYTAGATVANAVIAPVSAGGSVCFYSPLPVDVVVDINGWFRGTG